MGGFKSTLHVVKLFKKLTKNIFFTFKACMGTFTSHEHIYADPTNTARLIPIKHTY